MTRVFQTAPAGVDRRTVVAWAGIMPLLLGGCGGGKPTPGKPPAGSPDDGDLPRDGRYRFDFSGDLPG